MAYEHGRATLSAAQSTDDAQVLLIPIPQDGRDYEFEYRLAGTFVGTVQCQDDQSGSFAGIATVGAGETGGAVAAADPTAVGNFVAAVVSGAKTIRLLFSAYTSGSVEIIGVLIPTGIV